MGGLFLSWMGDVTLLFSPQSELFFAAGLGAFLIAHLLYIAAYIRTAHGAGGEAFLRRRPAWLLPFPLIFAGLTRTLYPAPGSIRIPVFAYTANILLLAVFALHRKGGVAAASLNACFLGALLLILSDSLLACDRFLVPVPIKGYS